jgi:two-component system cell cycle response regulator CpdR
MPGWTDRGRPPRGRLFPGMRIMFITGFAAVALSAGSRAPEGAKVLSKPIHLRELVAEVDRMLAAA